MKRSSTDYNAALKRARGPLVAGGRLCDLPAAVDLFTDVTNAEGARQKGFFGGRAAKEKYEEYERKLLALHKESDDIAPLDEEWLLSVLPELSGLEDETLDRLLTQSQRHSMYERAARELVMRDRSRQAEEHARELTRLRLEAAAELSQASSRAEMKIKENDESVAEECDALKTDAEEHVAAIKAEAEREIDELRTEAEEAVRKLEDTIEDLEGQLEAQQKIVEDLEAKATDDLDEQRKHLESMGEAMELARQETDLKRETSRKLKEEIIDNDRLTVANLNRIKQLETRLAQESSLVQELERENDELRNSFVPKEELKQAEEEIVELREVLVERESQLVSLSQKMSDVMENGKPSGGRRDSILSRLGLGLEKHEKHGIEKAYDKPVLGDNHRHLSSSYA